MCHGNNFWIYTMTIAWFFSVCHDNIILFWHCTMVMLFWTCCLVLWCCFIFILIIWFLDIYYSKCYPFFSEYIFVIDPISKMNLHVAVIRGIVWGCHGPELLIISFSPFLSFWFSQHKPHSHVCTDALNSKHFRAEELTSLFWLCNPWAIKWGRWRYSTIDRCSLQDGWPGLRVMRTSFLSDLYATSNMIIQSGLLGINCVRC